MVQAAVWHHRRDARGESASGVESLTDTAVVLAAGTEPPGEFAHSVWPSPSVASSTSLNGLTATAAARWSSCRGFCWTRAPRDHLRAARRVWQGRVTMSRDKTRSVAGPWQRPVARHASWVVAVVMIAGLLVPSGAGAAPTGSLAATTGTGAASSTPVATGQRGVTPPQAPAGTTTESTKPLGNPALAPTTASAKASPSPVAAQGAAACQEPFEVPALGAPGTCAPPPRTSRTGAARKRAPAAQPCIWPSPTTSTPGIGTSLSAPVPTEGSPGRPRPSMATTPRTAAAAGPTHSPTIRSSWRTPRARCTCCGTRVDRCCSAVR